MQLEHGCQLYSKFCNPTLSSSFVCNKWNIILAVFLFVLFYVVECISMYVFFCITKHQFARFIRGV